MHRLLAAAALWMSFVAAAPGADPIRIGVVNEITGPQAEGGRFTVNGIQLALDEINQAGGLLGRKVELRIEDNASTNPGTVLAFSKLLSDGQLADHGWDAGLGDGGRHGLDPGAADGADDAGELPVA